MRNRFIFGAIVVAAIGAFIFFLTYAEKKEGNFSNVINDQHIEYQKAILQTSAGDIEITFLSKEAPIAVSSFIALAEKNFYDGTKFHRVVGDFMIQGGDPLSKDDAKKELWGTGGPGYTFDDEPNNVELEHGVVAMANSGPNTNGSQFFIITKKNGTPWLQGKHTGFAKVTAGLDIVDAIGRAETDANDRPLVSIAIEKIILK